MKLEQRFYILLIATIGLISGFSVFMMNRELISIPACAIIAIGASSFIGIVHPPKLLLNSLFAALGIPVVALVRIIYEMAASVSDHNLFPIEVFFALMLGFVFAFGGMALGTAIRFIFRKIFPKQIQWFPSKTVLIILGSGFVLILLALLYMITDVKPTPTLETGILNGEETLSKTILVSEPEIGNVTSLRVLTNLSDTDAVLLVIGNKGALMLTPQGRVKSVVKFEERAGKVEPVRAGNNGEFEYVNRGGGWQPVSLFGSDGKLKWKYPTQEFAKNAPDDMVALDINNDSVLEFIVGMNGSGGLRAFEYSGKEIWMKDASNVFSVATVRENDIEEIIHTDGRETVVRSLNGDKLRSFKLPFDTFVMGRWPNHGNDPVIIGLSDMSIRAFDLNGSPVGSLPIQRTGTMVGVTPIDFRGQGVKHYAAVVSLRASMNLSELYLFDRNDSLIYHEVLKGMYPSVTAIPARNSEGEFLLVGGDDGTVTQYRMKK